jgi:hypothetical protein
MGSIINRDYPLGYTHGDQFHHSDENDTWHAKALLLGATIRNISGVPGDTPNDTPNTSRWSAEYTDAKGHRYFFRAPTQNAACRNLVEHIAYQWEGTP